MAGKKKSFVFLVFSDRLETFREPVSKSRATRASAPNALSRLEFKLELRYSQYGGNNSIPVDHSTILSLNYVRLFSLIMPVSFDLDIHCQKYSHPKNRKGFRGLNLPSGIS
jgi:hypothetical protein